MVDNKTYLADELTPWELRDGMWYKREDLYRAENGVNGSKFRACRHLIETAMLTSDIDHVVSAQSVRSPQAAITATICQELGLGCTIIVGASKPETAIKHPSIRLAVEAGATLDTNLKVAYNASLQPYANALSEVLGAYKVPYAISPPANASEGALAGFLGVGGAQTRNIPQEVTDLVVAFGSGNTTAGMMYGLSRFANHNVERVHLVGVGPDRYEWMVDRLSKVGATDVFNDVTVDLRSLHGWYADYADSMPETIDDIVMHPTYEGKVVRFLNEWQPDWWTRRDGTTGFWIVGGPF